MGTNIGIEVKRQEEGYGMYGSNPRGSLTEIGDRVRAFVNARVPEIDGKTAYAVYDPEIREGWYHFDVRLFTGGGDLSGAVGDLILGALAAWACLNFNHEEGVEIRTYWSS